MVITFICAVLGEPNNGTTIATLNVIEAMKKRGHEVRVLCCDKEREGQEGYYVVKKVNFGPFNNYVAHNGVAPASGKDMETIKKAIEGADVVHFNFTWNISAKVVRYCNKMGIATTASMHTSAENYTNHIFLQFSRFANWVMYKVLYHALFKHVDAIHFPSQFIYDLSKKEWHFKNYGEVISNGIQNDFKRIPVERPKELEGKIVVAYTARYSREKMHKVLLKAMKYSKHRDDIVLILPGAGPLEKKMRKWAKKWCKNEPIFGFHDHEEMVKILNYCDIYAHCGHVDIEPISFLEAVSVGLPPVLTDSKQSAVSTFAIDKKLNVYKHNSPKDLAAHIDYFIDHPEAREENAKGYLGYAQKFDFETSMDKMEQFFLKTIERKKHEKA